MSLTNKDIFIVGVSKCTRYIFLCISILNSNLFLSMKLQEKHNENKNNLLLQPHFFIDHHLFDQLFFFCLSLFLVDIKEVPSFYLRCELRYRIQSSFLWHMLCEEWYLNWKLKISNKLILLATEIYLKINLNFYFKFTIK